MLSETCCSTPHCLNVLCKIGAVWYQVLKNKTFCPFRCQRSQPARSHHLHQPADSHRIRPSHKAVCRFPEDPAKAWAGYFQTVSFFLSQHSLQEGTHFLFVLFLKEQMLFIKYLYAMYCGCGLNQKLFV